MFKCRIVSSGFDPRAILGRSGWACSYWLHWASLLSRLRVLLCDLLQVDGSVEYYVKRMLHTVWFQSFPPFVLADDESELFIQC